MQIRRVRSGLLCLIVAAAGVQVLSWTASWGCVPLRSLVSVGPTSSGPAGSSVSVNGLGFGDGTIEVRWNGLEGQRLAEATGPDFSVPVVIPQVPDGMYQLIVLSRETDKGVATSGSASFLVSSSPVTPPIADPSPTHEVDASEASGARSIVWGTALLVLGALLGVILTRGRRKAS